MKLLLRIVCLFLLASGFAFQAEAPDAQAGNFLYWKPTGWNVVEKGDTTILYCPASPAGTSTFISMAASDLEGDLQNSFNILWGGFKNAYRILQGGQISPLHARGGYDAFTTSALAQDQSGRRWTTVVMGAQYKQRIQIVMFMSDLPPNSSEENACLNIFRKFLASLRFGDALPGQQAPPAAGATSSGAAASPEEEKPHRLAPGALEGIYMGYGLGGGGRMELRRLDFNPDGWVIVDVPQEGMIGFDFTAYRNSPNTNRNWVGRYRADGNAINIVWQDYTDHREQIRRNETSFSPGINVYVPMCRCAGRRFAGKYLFGLKTSGQYIQFFPDGTFLDHGVLDQMLLPNAYYDHPRTQRGTYAIQSQTIIFTFADGRRGMRTFYAPKAQESSGIFDYIGLGWHVLYEERHVDEP